ncbi:hypothetical protein SmJEL517_g03336 [Synchytrium microbalum]|uniref:BTB domain-containing protein n=1 Tax=Synchytrium microbalum TaxID=1806994 RepID=A0A507BYK4_9FUNG|nr:uncharacterized protein SmJEL517_g03336 [Synchytrium microbalum]TPX33887.1 hypothetical protein SmJEL517_g03336 [Synchytrium microbalum]
MEDLFQVLTPPEEIMDSSDGFFRRMRPDTPRPSLSESHSDPTSSHRSTENLRRLSNIMYQHGFLSGMYSDVVVRALKHEWKLHKLVLCHNDYFSGMLQGPWLEKDRDTIEINFDDPNVTVEAMTIVLARTYGHFEMGINMRNVCALLATGAFFGDKDLCEACVEFINEDLSKETLQNYFEFADAHYYGTYSDSIIDACFTKLCRDGYDELKDVLTVLPLKWLERILAADCFYVPSEMERYRFIKEVIAKRKSLNVDGSSVESSSRIEIAAKVSGGLPLTPPKTPIRGMRVSIEGLFIGESDSLSPKSTRYDNLVDSSAAVLFGPLTPVDEHTDMDDGGEMLHEGACDHSTEYAEDGESTDSEARSESSTSLRYKVDEPNPYRRMLGHGSIFSHLKFEDLLAIRDDNSILPYTVPERVLQRALWVQQELRCRIESSPDDLVELGLAYDTRDITDARASSPISLAGLSSQDVAIVPADDTDKIDGRRLSDVLSQPVYSHSAIKFPPFRFGAEFTDLRRLHGGCRFYSKTTYYAGSSWVIYLQKIVVDGIPKLGIYLQRWAPDANETPDPLLAPPSHRLSHYLDRRVECKVFFRMYIFFGSSKIRCYVLESKPDLFKNTQSWGWRSHRLFKDALFVEMPRRNDSMRCTVVMGIV